MKVEELVYGTRGNETFLTLYLTKATQEELSKLDNRGGIYMIYNHEDELLYVGESTRLRKRLKSHLLEDYGKVEINKDTFAYVLYQYVGVDKYERCIIEGLLVQKYKPALNCTDEMVRKASATLNDDTVNDVLYYVRNTSIKDYIVAKALNVRRENVRDMRVGNTHAHKQLPSGYVPTVHISKEFIEENTQIKTARITKEEFNEARELLNEGLVKQTVIASKLGISNGTVSAIKKLERPTFREWERERLEKAVA